MTTNASTARSGALADGAIDTHAHVYPAAYLDLLEECGADPSTTAIARNLGADSSDADLSERLRWMDAAQVGVQVLAVTPQSPSLPDPSASAVAARWINDEYDRIRRAHPDRFLLYGALPLPHVEASLRELERIAGGEGVVGISLPAVLPDGASPADAAFEEVWAALDALGTVVNIHATGSGARSPLITDWGLDWVNGAPVEDAIATLQLMKAGIPQRFPRLTLHIAHLAGDLPFLVRRLEDNYEDWNAFPASPSTTLASLMVDAAKFSEPSLRMTAEVLGASRIMVGSDHPYFQREKYVRAVDYVRSAQLDDEAITGILRGNAERLYGGRI
ncbi:amidohydrolase [Brachybacterium halotolerans subsp. kimchii]|uniref:amidohydrolase family protein n=1 Tax=Brachybacterium halotolerans TaxID=2795215 RepID=UPI001E2B4E37|nr:amidohydrolase family protein [Brachybacterium halotolerans]UEJ81900.1 amidohydrolase [Brachybacterium halotolerans subsp. kimchii]